MTTTRRAGIKDVAALAGVSQATVSRALNADLSAMVTEETRMRVLAAAESLEYFPNPLAVGMQKGRSAIVGLVITSLADAYLASRIIDGAHRVLWDGGVLLAVMSAAGSPQREQVMFKRLYGRRVDGVIYVATSYQVPDVASRTPMVLVNAESGTAAMPCVVPDEIEGAAAAVAELVAAGHLRIGFVAPTGAQPAAGRLHGYRQALTRAGLPEDPQLIIVDDQATIRGGWRAVTRLLQRPARPTAVLCHNDRMAVGAYEAARGVGLEVPDDLSVIAFEQDGPAVAETLSPSLTTIALPHFEMGTHAATAILDLISESPPINGERGQRTLVPCNLHRRCSVARPRAAAIMTQQ